MEIVYQHFGVILSNRSVDIRVKAPSTNIAPLWMGELMSAQLKVSLHHVATWSRSSIHHSPCCLYREKPCHTHKAYSKVAERPVRRLNGSWRISRASVATNTLRPKQFSYVDLMHSNTMRRALTLSEQVHQALSLISLNAFITPFERPHVSNYTQVKAVVASPVIHPSSWMAALFWGGWGARLALKVRASGGKPLFVLERDPTGCRNP